MQIQKAIKQFKSYQTACGNSPHTIRSYMRDLALLEKYLGSGQAVGDVSPSALTEFITSPAVSKKDDGTSKAQGSIDKTKTSVKAFFRWLQDSDTITRNPANILRMKHRFRSAPDVLTPTEMKKLLKTLDHTKGHKAERDALLIAIILNTGLRVSEVTAIDMNDIEIASRKLTITAKGNETHLVFINTKLCKRISVYLKKRKHVLAECQALFLSNRLTRLSVRQAETIVKDWIAKVGITKKITIHGLRHTFATTLLDRTGNLKTVQEALRHKNISTTTIYTHQPSETLQNALEAL